MKLKFLTNNFSMKAIALIIAVGLWLFVSATLNTVSKFPGNISVKAVNVPTSLAAIYDTKEVSLKISAEPSIWKQLSSENFSAFVDLNGLTAGTHNLKVIVNSNLPGVEVVEVTPSNIMVRVEAVSEKTVDISSSITGQAADGQTVGLVEFEPEKVTISGPKSEIDAIGTATAEIKLSGESDDFERQIVLKVLNDKSESIQGVSISPSEVKAKVKIVKAGNNKTVGIKVNTSGFPATGFYVNNLAAEPSTVDIVGQSSVLQTVQYIETQTIDITGQNATISRSVSLSLPAGVSLQRDANQKVKITITFSASDVTKELTATISPSNLSPGLKVQSYDPASIKVLVSGPADKINSLTSADVILNIDLGGKSTGTSGIDLKSSMFKVPSGISVSSFLPSSISVNILAM